MLTNRGIEANLDRCSSVIDVRSPTNVNEVHKLLGRTNYLMRFLSKSIDKMLPLFCCLHKNQRFVWIDEYKEAFG